MWARVTHFSAFIVHNKQGNLKVILLFKIHSLNVHYRTENEVELKQMLVLPIQIFGSLDEQIFRYIQLFIQPK